MWPFKKKKNIAEAIVEKRTTVKTILCIPGFWSDPIEIIDKTNGRFMVVGDVLMDVINARHYSFEFCDADERMRKSFEVAGKVTLINDVFLNEINKHTSVIYISCETGSLYDAWFLASAGVALLNAGGIGVKVESAGKAFDKNKWLELVASGTELTMYELFVVDSLTDEEGTVFSCGMHNIGLVDTILSNVDFIDAYEVIKIFNIYQLLDKPIITDNQTFRTDINSPFYRIKEELNQPYKNEDLFRNPFGMWRLIKE